MVDGVWKVSDKYPTEPDEEGNSNNILHAASLVAPSESGIAGGKGPASPIKNLAEDPEVSSAAPTTMDEVRSTMAAIIAPVAAVPAVAAIGRSLGYGGDRETTSSRSPTSTTGSVPGGYPTTLDRNASYGQTSSGDSPVLESVGNQSAPSSVAPTSAVAATEAKALAQQNVDVGSGTPSKYSKDEIAVGSAVATGAMGGAAGAAAYSVAEKEKLQQEVIPVTGDTNLLQTADVAAPSSSAAPTSRDVVGSTASDPLSPLASEATQIPSLRATESTNDTTAEKSKSSATKSTQKAEVGALGATGVGATAAVGGARSTKTQAQQLEAAAVNASKHAADRAIAGIKGGENSTTAATAGQFNAEAALKSLDKKSGITAIGTAQTAHKSDSDEHPKETGMSKMVAAKADSGQVNVDENVKTGVVSGVNLSSPSQAASTNLQDGNTKVERLGDGSRAAVASTTVIKTVDGQQVRALGTAVVTDGSQTAEQLKQDLVAKGSAKSADLPDGAISHLTSPPTQSTTPTPTTTTTATSNAAPSAPSKQATPSTPSKNVQSTPGSAATTTTTSTPGTEEKKKKGIWKKIKKALA